MSVEDQEITRFVRVALVEDGLCPARIETLCVAPAHRAKGIGRALVERATRWCIEHGADEICVDFIAPNTEARGFYERLGYTPLLMTYVRRLSPLEAD